MLGAIVFDLAIEDPDRSRPLRDAARVARRASGQSRPRVLVIANETVGGEELREELLRRGPPRPELRVVAPVLVSRSHYVTSDIDRELEEARRRLDGTLAWATEQGFDAAGRVNDADPFTSIEDDLRRFAADEVASPPIHPVARTGSNEGSWGGCAMSSICRSRTSWSTLERQRVEIVR